MFFEYDENLPNITVEYKFDYSLLTLEDDHFQDVDNSLTIRNFQISDRGIYYCVLSMNGKRLVYGEYAILRIKSEN